MLTFSAKFVPRFVLTAGLSALTLVGCATPQKSTTNTAAMAKKKKPLVMKEKPGAKNANEGDTPQAPVANSVVAPPQPIVAAQPVVSLEKRQVSFMQAHLAEESKVVSDEEEKAVLPGTAESVTPGSLGEACAVVIIAKRVVNPGPAKSTGFVEQDTTGPADKVKSPALIETMAQQRFIDFSRALEVNAFLQNPAAQKLALRAVEKSSDNQPFKDRTYAAMRRISDQWTSHLVNLGKATGTAIAVVGQSANGGPNSEQATGIGGTPATNAAGTATAKDGKDVAALALSDLPPSSKPVDVKPVEIGKEEGALQEAQSLADAGKYQEAIAKAQGVSPQSQAHAKAQEKIRSFSNRAVQELRMKAAQAFQGSLPISDPKARTAYLERARKFLEEAIKVYPQADQLGTVKENLAVITRDIERLKN